MQTSLQKALDLMLIGDRELGNILLVTAKMSLSSSQIALALDVPTGLWLGSCRFRGKQALVILNRTLMGMSSVVCGLLMYMLFSGVGPFGKWKLLFTVEIMVIAQMLLITPLVVGNLETYVERIAQPVRETAWGLGLGKPFFLLANECVYPIFSTYFLSSRGGIHGGRHHRLEKPM